MKPSGHQATGPGICRIWRTRAGSLLFSQITLRSTLPYVTDHHELEEGSTLTIDFSKLTTIGAAGHSVVPVAVQDADTGEVLIVAYANEEALRATLDCGQAVFYSTSRDELWHKGATSGDTLTVVDVRVNCEQNSLLYRVRPDGAGACHTRDPGGQTRHGCYYRVVTGPDTLALV